MHRLRHGLTMGEHGFAVLVDPCAVPHDRKCVLGAGGAFQMADAGDKLSVGDEAVTVVQQTEQVPGLRRVHAQHAHPDLDLRARQDVLKLLEAELPISRLVGQLEQRRQLPRERGHLVVLLLDHHVGVVRGGLQRVLEKDRGYDADHGKDDRSDVQEEHEAVNRAHLFDKRPCVVRPAAAEGDLEDGVQCPGGRPVVAVHPPLEVIVLVSVEDDALHQLAEEEREHQHEDEEDGQGPEEGHEAHRNGAQQHPELPEKRHGPDHPHGLRDAGEAHQAHEGNAVVFARGAELGEHVRVEGREDHDRTFDQIRHGEEVRQALDVEPHYELDQECHVEEVSYDDEGGGLLRLGEVHVLTQQNVSIWVGRLHLQLHEHDNRAQDDQAADTEVEERVADDESEATA
mmetsp:Transcript_37627/g.112311  ORF Transcript_37627/g.112311 Transcript_37627/m.112311 type:complete len:400 (+) Transcript_37627:240-1439(+)